MSPDGTLKQKGTFGFPRPPKGFMAYDENTSRKTSQEQRCLLCREIGSKYNL